LGKWNCHHAGKDDKGDETLQEGDVRCHTHAMLPFSPA
jgi:hypothetical protein